MQKRIFNFIISIAAAFVFFAAGAGAVLAQANPEDVVLPPPVQKPPVNTQSNLKGNIQFQSDSPFVSPEDLGQEGIDPQEQAELEPLLVGAEAAKSWPKWVVWVIAVVGLSAAVGWVGWSVYKEA